jgi:hypothetical protein
MVISFGQFSGRILKKKGIIVGINMGPVGAKKHN